MQTIIEDKLKFTFRDGWTVSKFDEWSFYKGQFSRVGDAQILCKNCGGVCRCSSCGTKRVAGMRWNRYPRDQSGVWLLAHRDQRLPSDAGDRFRVSLPCCGLEGSGHTPRAWLPPGNSTPATMTNVIKRKRPLQLRGHIRRSAP